MNSAASSYIVKPNFGFFAGVAVAYILPFVFYGPVASMVPLLLKPPKQHWTYYAAYVVGTVAALYWVHKGTATSINRAYLALRGGTLEFGRSPKAAIEVSDIVKAIPVTYKPGLLVRKRAYPSTKQQCNAVLLKLNDGGRVLLMPLSNMVGIQEFLLNFMPLIESVTQEQTELSAEDAALIHPAFANTISLSVVS